MVISQFFTGLGLKFRNNRWSWGAQQGNVILLRTWSHEQNFKERKVIVLQDTSHYEGYGTDVSHGLDERIKHLDAIWVGGIAAYLVMANAEDTNVFDLTIKDFREDIVYAISHLAATPEGGIAAVFSGMVPVADFRKHALTHRCRPGEGPLPADESLRSGMTTSSYRGKVPLVREHLISLCHQQTTVNYGELMQRFALTFYPLLNVMGKIGNDCKDASLPILTSVIVHKETGHCSKGIREEFDVLDDDLERERCYSHWTLEQAPDSAPEAVTQEEFDLTNRAVQFAEVAVRPDQARFRKAVFLACNGQCVVSGCGIPEALDAAHLAGRNWRDGHNEGSDGVLLRRDLHALYDKGLLLLSEGGGFQLHERVLEHYDHLIQKAP